MQWNRQRFLLAFLGLLALSIATELVYLRELERAAHMWINMDRVSLLYRVRPLISISFYFAALFVGYHLAAQPLRDRLLSGLLIGIGLAVALVISDPWKFYFQPLSDGVFNALIDLLTSRFYLTMHLSSLIAALGFISLLPAPKRSP